MEEIRWTAGMQLPHDPDAFEVFEFDWTEWLDSETLASVELITDGGIEAAQTAIAGTTVQFSVTGGSAGRRASVTVRAISSTGRQQDRTLAFRVVER